MENSFTAIIEKTNNGFSGYFKELDGVISAEDTIHELKESLQEALEYRLAYLEEIGKTNVKLKDANIDYKVDLEQFFEHYNVINKSAFARYIGINPSLFRQYIRGLASLSDDKMLQITNGLHKLASDIEDIVLV